METREFLESVLSGSGFYCIVGVEELHGEKRRAKVKQTFHADLDSAIDTANQYDSEGLHAYFGLATYEDDNSRKNDNVKYLKSFYLDLDCGVGKDYESQAQALQDLRSFCSTLRLPRPTLVNSGRGVHVYWLLTESVSRVDWLPVAERLKELCAEHGLLADPSVTADAARVLRVPGTHNYKDSPAPTVSVVGNPSTPIEFGAFRDLLGVNPFAKPKGDYVPREPDAVLQALLGNFTSKFKTILIKTVQGKGCDQLKWIIQNQTEMSEPMWRAGLSIAAFCEDKDKAIHRISHQHPEYSPALTYDKVSRIKGPYTCKKFDEYNPGVCPECPNWGEIKSPILLGKELAGNPDEPIKVIDHPSTELVGVETEQEYEIPAYPPPYKRGANGAVFMSVKNEDEVVDVPIYHNALYVVRRIRDPELGESVVMRLHLPKDGVREFTMPLTAVMARDEFRTFMAKHGVAVLKLDNLMAYVTQWVNKLQMESEATEARRQFGWTAEDGESFVVGAIEVKKDRIDMNPPSTATAGLFPAFKPKGTLEEWKKTISFYNRPGFEVHQYMMGIGFGAPLMQFLPISGSIFHLYHKESGLGKTTAMLAGASIWGNPEMLVLFEKDTTNTKMNRLEVYKNLPGYFDEMTNTAPKELSDVAYAVPSGMQRNRMSSKGNVERYRGSPWHLIVGMTGNTSVIERVSVFKALPKAEAQRVLEYRAPIIAFPTKEETDTFSKALLQHYGHAGAIYINYILNNLDAVKELLAATQKRIDIAAGLKAENRFWSAQTAAVLTGIIIAKKAGLVDFNIKALFDWIINDLIANAKDGSAGMKDNVEAVLTDYLSENYNNILRITSNQDVRKDSNGIEKAVLPEASPRVMLVGRYEYDVKRLYLLPKPFKEWCAKYQINYSGLIDGLKEGKTNAKKVKQRLGKGTHVNLPPVDVIMLECAHFMDDHKEEFIAAKSAQLGETVFDSANPATDI